MVQHRRAVGRQVVLNFCFANFHMADPFKKFVGWMTSMLPRVPLQQPVVLVVPEAIVEHFVKDHRVLRWFGWKPGILLGLVLFRAEVFPDPVILGVQFHWSRIGRRHDVSRGIFRRYKSPMLGSLSHFVTKISMFHSSWIPPFAFFGDWCVW